MMILYIVTLLAPLFLLSYIFIGLVSKHQRVKEQLKHLPGEEQFLASTLMALIPSSLRKILFPMAIFVSSGDTMWKHHVFELRKKYGNVYKLVFGTMPVVVISDPDFAKVLLTRTGIHDLTKQTPVFSKLTDIIGNNAFTVSDYQIWKHHRFHLDPAFTDRSLSCVVDASRVVSHRFLKIIKERMKNGECIMDKLDKDFINVTLDIIGKAGFGYDFNSISPTHKSHSVSDFVFQILNYTKYALFVPYFILKTVTNKEKTMISARDSLFAIVDDIITERLNKEKKQYPEDEKNLKKDILQLLLDASRECLDLSQSEYNEQSSVGGGREMGLSRQEIIANSIVFLFAGHDTTSRTLSFACLLLASHPEKQAKMYEEVNKFFIETLESNWELMEMEHMSKLQYTISVVKEILRLYPPLPYVSRTTQKTISFKGFEIPKNVIVNIDFASKHRDEHYFKSPNEFVPERWLDTELEELIRRHPQLYTPFSIGNRSCIGKKFAMIEAVVVLCMIVQSFEVKLTPQYEKFDEKTDLTASSVLHFKKNLCLKFVNRCSH